MVGCVTDRGGQVFFVELRCTREAILRRLGNESRAKFGKLTDPAVYTELEAKNTFAFPSLPPALVIIDTEHMTPVAAATRIAELLKERLSAA
jgi:hypothetical protein